MYVYFVVVEIMCWGDFDYVGVECVVYVVVGDYWYVVVG